MFLIPQKAYVIDSIGVMFTKARIDKSPIFKNIQGFRESLQHHQRRLEVGVQGHGAATGGALPSAVRHVHRLRDLPGGIGDHRLRQRRHGFGAEAGLHGHQQHDTIP